jgi:hypothetical protein
MRSKIVSLLETKKWWWQKTYNLSFPHNETRNLTQSYVLWYYLCLLAMYCLPNGSRVFETLDPNASATIENGAIGTQL